MITHLESHEKQRIRRVWPEKGFVTLAIPFLASPPTRRDDSLLCAQENFQEVVQRVICRKGGEKGEFEKYSQEG